MELVKACPTCGYSNVPTSPFCSQCGVSLVAVAPLENVDQTLEKCNLHAVDTSKIICPDCKAENTAGAERCVYCDCSLTAAGDDLAPCHVDLTWPWGTERLTKPLRIGREPPSPECLIKEINAHGYDNISRSHAELLQDSATGGVSVIDLGSANGTFVDGIRIPPNKPIILKSGTVIRFAANLLVSVLITKG